MEKIRGNGYKLILGRFHLNTRRKFLTMRENHPLEYSSQESGGFPNTGHSQDSAGQGPRPSCLDCAFTRKGCTRRFLRSLPT